MRKLSLIVLLKALLLSLPDAALAKGDTVIDQKYSIMAFTLTWSSPDFGTEGPFPIVILYRAFEKDGVPFICGGVVNRSDASRVLKRIKVYSEDGAMIRRSISRFAQLDVDPILPDRRYAQSDGRFAANTPVPKQYIGQPSKCVRANGNWQSRFEQEGIRLQLPEFVKKRRFIY